MAEIYYARTDVLYRGGDKFFTITFPYIKKEHVKVFVNDVSTQNFTFNTESQIVVNDELETDDVVSIRRTTPIDSRMVIFSDTSVLDKEAQNLAQNQLFNAVQEVYDNNIQFNIDTVNLIAQNKADTDTQIAQNKADTDTQIAQNKADTDAAQAEFERDINETLSVVIEAAEKLEALDEAVATATQKAELATEKAEEAQTALENAQAAADKAVEAQAIIDSLDTATEETEGIAQISTNAQAIEALNDNTIMTPLKVKALYDYCNRVLENTQAARKDFLIAGQTHTSIKMCAGTLIKCTLSGTEYKLKQTEDEEFDVLTKLDTGDSLTAGKDYSIYLVENAARISGLDYVVSLNGVAPEGYTTENSYKIGGFHTICRTVTAANAPALTANTYWSVHPAIGFTAGDIIPISIWTLLHRPISEPNGMVYVFLLNLWVDIYLQSGTNALTKSMFGGTVTDSRSQIQHQWDLAQVGKRPATDYEFMVFAEGSNQRTNISGSAAPNPKVAGGHNDTNGKAMISGWFIEECCGYLWQWLLDAVTAASANAWAEYADKARGQYYWNVHFFLAGGCWADVTRCGSWCRDGNGVRSHVDAAIGCRGVSLPLFS